MPKVTTIDTTLTEALQNAAYNLSLVAPSLTTQSKTYETWAAFELSAALSKNGASVQALDHNGATTSTFRVRGGPGFMVPVSERGGDKPCHFKIDWNGTTVEMHISLVHVSRFGNLHEIDICVVDHLAAEYLRQQSHPLPFNGDWLVGAELKAYDTTTALDKNIARAALGLLLDLAPAAIAPSVQFKSRSGQVLLTGHFNGPQYFLLTSANIAQPTVRLLDTYGVKSRAGVWPGTTNTAPVINDIVADVKQRL